MHGDARRCSTLPIYLAAVLQSQLSPARSRGLVLYLAIRRNQKIISLQQ